MAVSENSLTNGNTLLGHLLQCRSVRALIRRAFLPTVICATVPGPPGIVSTLSIKRSFARNRDVSLFKRVDERRIIHQFGAFPTSEDHRQVVAGILAELDCGAARNKKVHITFQVNRAG